VSDFLSAVENFNKTMEQMHVMANRVNNLLDTVEEPIKSLVPQISRTIKTADAMVEQLSAPIDRVVPGLSALADVLASPTLTAMPKELADFMAVLSELARRLQPLGAMAESAGSMFGLRPFAAMLSSASQPSPKPTAAIEVLQTAVAKAPAAKKAAAKKAAARKAPAKKPPTAKKAPATKKPAKKSASKKAAPRKR
jgi:ABC-type transporter Mla subunit MlaD